MNILTKRWRRLALFLASLLTAVLFSFASNQAQAYSANAVSAKTVVQSSFARTSASPAFKRVAASHLEPNFYH